MTELPLVTIAIPTYNRVGFLRQTVESALSQTYTRIQVIVSDNASTDDTAAYAASIRDPRLLFLQQRSNIGMIGNWNACLDRAQGEYFILLSDDDYLEKTAIAALVGAIEKSEKPAEIAWAYCRTWEINPEGVRQRIHAKPCPYESAKDFALAYFSGKRVVLPCATLIRTADIREIGGYTQQSVVLAVDAMVWSRTLLKRGAIVAVDQPLSNYRIHPGRETSSQEKIDVWRHDIAAFTGLWFGAFADSAPAVQRQLKHAAEHYTSWNLAAFINQSANSFSGQFRALRFYYHCRREFANRAGIRNLIGGLAKLFVPEFAKRPIRSLALRIQGS